MKFIGTLMETAEADTDVLRRLLADGDTLSVPREVDFLLRAPSLAKAEAIAGFLSDYQFASAEAREKDGQFLVRVFITMPVTQNVILSISGFLACVAHLFSSEYDGWGCTNQRQGPT